MSDKEEGYELLKRIIRDHRNVVPSLLSTPSMQCLVDRYRRFSIFRVPQDILALILSHCNLSDVKNIVLVCHAWSQILKNPLFWKRHMLHRFQKDNPTLFLQHLWRERIQNVIFTSLAEIPEICPVVRINYEWLFQKTWRIRTGEGRYADAYCEIRVFGQRNLTYWFVKDSPTIDQYGVFLNKGGLGVKFFCLPNEHGVTMYVGEFSDMCDFYDMKVGRIKCAKDGMLYSGASLDVKPHGTGCWEWPDEKRIFRGNNVAFAGIPHGVGLDQDGNTVEYRCGERVHKRAKLSE